MRDKQAEDDEAKIKYAQEKEEADQKIKNLE